MEKELLGIYVSSHPLTERQADVEAFGQNTTRQMQHLGDGTPIKLAAMISSIKTRIGKSGRSEGKKWAIVEFEDLEGKIEGMVFADTFEALTARDPTLLKADRVVIVDANVDRKREAPCLMVKDIMPIEEAAAKLTTGVLMRLDTQTHGLEAMAQLEPLLKKYKGGIETWMSITCANGRRAAINPGRGVRVRAAPEFIKDFETAFGPGSIELLGPGSARKKKLQQQKLFAEQQATVEAPPVEMAMDVELESAEAL
jgi:DNA polymerase-3 subunit alpha